MSEIYTLSWVTVHMIFSACPLLDGFYAEKRGLAAHHNCPPSHSDRVRVDRKSRYAMTTSSETAWAHYIELAGSKCGDLDDQVEDCIESAKVGTGQVLWTDDKGVGHTEPGTVIQKWP